VDVNPTAGEAHVTRILIADDHAAARGALKQLLEGHAGWQVCGEAADGRDAVQKAQELKPDVVVLDFQMPTEDGLRAAGQLSKVMPALPIVMFTIYNTPRLEAAATNGGVHAVIGKEGPRALVRAVEDALRTHSQSASSSD
jgi:DNA-binding NarL/FixJ family response regulator